jgi:hypothetical protein
MASFTDYANRCQVLFFLNQDKSVFHIQGPYVTLSIDVSTEKSPKPENQCV